MRYSKDHKRQTHGKMVEVASRKFREHGFDGVSIGELMSELQLTHGGFYRHFSNKEQLYTEALTFSIDDMHTRLVEHAADSQSLTLKEVIHTYLSVDHCQEIANGCPVAALSGEIVRQTTDVQQSFDISLQVYMNRFLPLMPGISEAEKRQQFLVLFTGMAGALSVARAVSDQALRDSILESARTFYTKTFCE